MTKNNDLYILALFILLTLFIGYMAIEITQEIESSKLAILKTITESNAEITKLREELKAHDEKPYLFERKE